jgi:hypothetical protein
VRCVFSKCEEEEDEDGPVPLLDPELHAAATVTADITTAASRLIRKEEPTLITGPM